MKMMIVCSDRVDDLKSNLVWRDWKVIWVRDAKTAIAKVRRERIHLAVLISTGAEMDVTETLLNLRDIRRSMPIVVVSQTGDDNEHLARQQFVPLSNTKVLPLSAIDSFVSSLTEASVRRKTGLGNSIAS
jgi:DNA-binding NtrC family response regulator